MEGNNSCPYCAKLEQQLVWLQEENRKLRLEVERLKKTLENIAFSASAAVVPRG
jgi:regulator of replication initiation timing